MLDICKLSIYICPMQTELPMDITIYENAFTKADFKTLIDQLESQMQVFLKAKDLIRANKLQNLIGSCIDEYNNDNPEFQKLFEPK